MSAETYGALEDAIRAHLADESDEAEIATDWYLIVAAEAAVDDRTNYWHMSSPSPTHTQLGLLTIGIQRMSRTGDE